MKIAVLGLGNVGLVAALGLCEQGHEVIGIEINKKKVEQLQKGEAYILESGLEELILKHQNIIKYSTSLEDCKDCEVFVVCVGTPASIDGSVFLGQVEKTISDLSRLIAGEINKTVILRSTIPPGTIEKKIMPLIQSNIGLDFIYHPEFLREGSAVSDFLDPNLHVIGYREELKNENILKLFENAPILKKVSYSTAEMIKYLNNSFHALKVSFINEIGSIAKAYQVDEDELIECFLEDKKLNISEKYLKPGFAFGGPCLNKDLRALNYLSKSKKINTPLIDSIMKSNEEHLMRAVKKINDINPKSILIFGVTFKEGTNDLRNSPAIDIIKILEKTPSYIPKKNIFVKDSPLVLQELKDLVNCTLVENDKSYPQDIDLIIIGSLRLGESDINFCNKFQGSILDLGYGLNQIQNKVVLAYE